MKLIKSEVIKHVRKDTFAIPGSKNVLIKTNDRYHIETPDGKRLTKALDKVSKFTNGLASYEFGEKVGLVTADGQFFLEGKYDKIVVDGDIVRILSKGKWGFMNRDFKIIRSPKFIFLEKFINGYARFRNEENKWGIVNITGTIVVKAKYSFLGELTGEQIAAKKYSGYGAINIHGKEVVPFVYNKIGYCGEKVELFNYTGDKCLLD